MGVTNYHTINGRIVGQTKNGVRTHYVPDALGSVVATLDANGTVENTYRYKPYGGLLAKTGTGDDPRFMWIGTYSYRANAFNHGQCYLRTRHYDHLSGRFCAKDTLFRLTDPYGYCKARPSTFIDPYGMFSYSVVSGPQWLSYCGKAELWVRWNIQELGIGFFGYVVQHTTAIPSVKDCQGRIVPSKNPFRDFFEAWMVAFGEVWVGDPPRMLDSAHDIFQTTDEGPCRYGFLKIVGKVKLVPGPLVGDFAAGTVFDAGDAYSTYNTPPWWSDAGALDHRLEVTFGCCCTTSLSLICPLYTFCPEGPYLCPPKAT